MNNQRNDQGTESQGENRFYDSIINLAYTLGDLESNSSKAIIDATSNLIREYMAKLNQEASEE